MSQFCVACNNKLDLISNNDEENTLLICECGVYNHIEYINNSKRQLNVALIKHKMSEILNDKLFEKIDDKIKQEIVSNSSKIGTHIANSLKCFALIFIESKNLLYFNDEFAIKKRQRKNAIQILVSINTNVPTIFVRTPITYIQTYANEYSADEYESYINISECLLFLNACNKKNMQSIYEKIHNAILEKREYYKNIECIDTKKNTAGLTKSDTVETNKTKRRQKRSNKSDAQINIKTSNLSSIIRFIALSNLNVKDLLYAENIFVHSKITTLKSDT